MIVGGAAFLLWPSEASRVRARVVEAADGDLGASGRRGLRSAGASHRSGENAVAPDVVVEAEPGGPAIRGREAVAALATQLSTAGGPRRVELSDIEVTLDEDSTHAVVTAIARVTSRRPAPRQRAEPRRASTAT